MTQNTPLCQDIVTKDYDPWFSDDADEQKFARGVCKQCPAWATCMTHALVNDFPYGIFAGLDPDERKPLHDKMFRELDSEHLAALQDKYLIADTMPTEYASPSVEAKYRRRAQRSEYCYERLMNTPAADLKHHERWLRCVTAVMDHPTGTGEELSRYVGVCGATFNEYLRDCFEHFGLDLSVL